MHRADQPARGHQSVAPGLIIRGERADRPPCYRRKARVKYTLPVMFKLGNDAPESKSADTPTREAKVDENGVYMVCDEMPEFPGGMAECMKWLGANINYPETAQKNGVQGRVIVQFVVNTDGSIIEPQVARGIDPELDAEALRLINAMPKWKPGKQQGKAVRVKYTLPIAYRLQ